MYIELKDVKYFLRLYDMPPKGVPHIQYRKYSRYLIFHLYPHRTEGTYIELGAPTVGTYGRGANFVILSLAGLHHIDAVGSIVKL